MWQWLLVVGAAVALDDPLLVKLESGWIRGFKTKGARAWLGVPFAQPPVKELRWRAPVPEGAWNGTRESSRFGPACLQEQNSFTELPDVNNAEDW